MHYLTEHEKGLSACGKRVTFESVWLSHGFHGVINWERFCFLLINKDNKQATDKMNTPRFALITERMSLAWNTINLYVGLKLLNEAELITHIKLSLYKVQ